MSSYNATDTKNYCSKLIIFNKSKYCNNKIKISVKDSSWTWGLAPVLYITIELVSELSEQENYDEDDRLLYTKFPIKESILYKNLYISFGYEYDMKYDYDNDTIKKQLEITLDTLIEVKKELMKKVRLINYNKSISRIIEKITQKKI
jgi:hypothetical protein